MLILALRSARVQTAAIRLLTGEISKALNVDAHIGEVDIEFPLSMCLEDFYLSDQQGDTLIHVPSMKVRFNPFTLDENKLSFPLVHISNPTLNIVQDSASTNLDFLVRAFMTDSTEQKMSYTVNLDRIQLENARIRYRHIQSGTDVILSNVQSDIGLRKNGVFQAELRQLHIRAGLASLDGYLEADFRGTLDSICADHLHIVYRDVQIFDGCACVLHPTQRDSMHFSLDCNDLYANSHLISSLVSDLTHRPCHLPVLVEQMGNVHYRGNIDGVPDDLQLNGVFLSNAGSITTRLSVMNKQSIRGQISTKKLALGKLLDTNELGNLSATVAVDGLVSDSLMMVNVSGQVPYIEAHGYKYTNLHLKGAYSPKNSHCNFTIKDPNITLLLTASYDATAAVPAMRVQLDVPHMNLTELHLTDAANERSISFRSSADLKMVPVKGNKLDGLVGNICIDSLQIISAGKVLLIPMAQIGTTNQDGSRRVFVESPVLTATIEGRFNWSTLPASILAFLHRDLPVLIPKPIQHAPNNLDFSVQMLHTSDWLHLISPTKWQVVSDPIIQGYIHEEDSAYNMQLIIPELVQNNSALQNAQLVLNNDNPLRQLSCSLFVKRHVVSPDSSRFKVGDVMAQAQLELHQNVLTTRFEFGSDSVFDTIPDLLIQTTFSKKHMMPIIDIHLLPTNFALGIQRWYVSDSHIHYDMLHSLLQFDQLQLHTDSQSLMVDGTMSKRMDDSVRVQLQDVDLGYILSVTPVLDVIDFRGKITGWVTLYGAFSSPKFEANVFMPHGVMNNSDLGTISATAELDRDNREIIIAGTAVKDDVCIANVTGRVVTTKPNYWELFVDANGVPLNFLSRWTTGIVDDVEGLAYGLVHIFGSNRRTFVTTRAYAKDAAFTVPYTGCRYMFSDSVILDTAFVEFPSVRLLDSEGHRGVLNGRMYHQSFTNFRFDMNMKCADLLGIDLPSNGQNFYYGRAYANGGVTLTGDTRRCVFDIDATTVGNTDFYLSLATASSATSSEFISFNKPMLQIRDTIVASKPSSHVILNMAIEATPQARAHLVLDEHNGDGIVGRGEGTLRFDMDATTGETQLLGTYLLKNGTFSYSVGNLVHRDFTIAEGSTVTWLGDATNPQLDIVAKYRCTASLRDLFGSDVTSVTSRSSIPVDCVIRVTGEMNNMILKFGIEYPQSEESVAAQINSVINTEAMLMRQVVYLLIFNRFYTPENMRTNNQSARFNDAYSLLSSTVTGQINSWLSKLTSMVNVGFNMRSDGDVGNLSYETEANIQIQPIDRLTINGNVGYRYNDLTNKPFFGDADMEYELTADGKLRAKVFTHSVDKYSLHQSGMQEGVGFIFRHDFNPGDAKKRREAKKNMKQTK